MSPQTIKHIHKLLAQILSSAVKADKLRTSPIEKVQTTPTVKRPDIQVLDDAELAALLKQLKGKPLYMPVLLAASTGMRRGEVLALPWRNIDLKAGTLKVTQAVELVGWTISLQPTKTERSKRTIVLPETLIAALGAHRAEQAAHCLRIGVSRFVCSRHGRGACKTRTTLANGLRMPWLLPSFRTSRSMACGIRT